MNLLVCILLFFLYIKLNLTQSLPLHCSAALCYALKTLGFFLLDNEQSTINLSKHQTYEDISFFCMLDQSLILYLHQKKVHFQSYFNNFVHNLHEILKVWSQFNEKNLQLRLIKSWTIQYTMYLQSMLDVSILVKQTLELNSCC